jgi:hypothetical protein
VSDGGFHINQRISFLDFGFQQAALSGWNNRQLNIEWVPASRRANVALSSKCDGHVAPYDLKRSCRRLSILRLHR